MQVSISIHVNEQAKISGSTLTNDNADQIQRVPTIICKLNAESNSWNTKNN